MIKFDDGTEISWEEAAVMIEAEGRLISDKLINDSGERCVVGVLSGAESLSPRIVKRRYSADPDDDSPFDRMIQENNFFQGTPEERAVYMAGWMRAQGDLESQELGG